MKKIYIPSEAELTAIARTKNANTYKYLLAKVVEKLLANNIYVMNLDSSLKEIKELLDAIYYIYPQELLADKIGSKDKALCMRILAKESSDAIYNLDNLSRFDDSILNDLGIIIRTIELLYKRLPQNPEYRFTYKNNLLLDNIFNVSIPSNIELPDVTISKLMEIEPIYTFRYPNNTGVADNIRLAVAIDTYTEKYGIPYYIGREYLNKNIIDNPDEKTKRLIKYLYK